MRRKLRGDEEGQPLLLGPGGDEVRQEEPVEGGPLGRGHARRRRPTAAAAVLAGGGQHLSLVRLSVLRPSSGQSGAAQVASSCWL